MTIGFITPEYPHGSVKSSAGIGTSMGNLIPGLVKNGIRVILFVIGQDADEKIVENGYILYRIKTRKYKFASWFFSRKYLQKFVNRKIAEHKIDLIEAPDWTGPVAFCKFPIPLVIRFHGSDTLFCHLENRKQKQKNRWLERNGVLNADAFIAPTQFAATLSTKLLGVRKPVTVIHHGLSLETFKNDNPDQFENGLLLYTGTIIRKKGVLEFPGIMEQAWKTNPDARLVLIGSDSRDVSTGSASTWELIRKQLPDQHKDKITWLGCMPYSQMQQHIKKAHVCLYPTFAETLGMVTIEAMAMQKPVVSSNFPWVSEIIEDGISGFMQDPKDHVGVSEKINLLLNNRELSGKMGADAREKVKAGFDLERVVQQNVEFYNLLISR